MDLSGNFSIFVLFKSWCLGFQVEISIATGHGTTLVVIKRIWIFIWIN